MDVFGRGASTGSIFPRSVEDGLIALENTGAYEAIAERWCVWTNPWRFMGGEGVCRDEREGEGAKNGKYDCTAGCDARGRIRVQPRSAGIHQR